MKKQALLVWLGILIAWSFYRAYTSFPEWVDELIFKPLIFIVPVLGIVSFTMKRVFASLGLKPSPRDFLMDLYFGVVVGIVFAFEAVFVNYTKHGDFSFHPILSAQMSGGIVPFLLINLVTSVWEETLARGYLYKEFLANSKRLLPAAFFSSALFVLLHVPIALLTLQLTGMSLIFYPFSILLLGIVNCYLFSLRGSLVLPILIHLFWNMTVALYL